MQSFSQLGVQGAPLCGLQGGEAETGGLRGFGTGWEWCWTLGAQGEVTQNVQNRMSEPGAELGPSSWLGVSNQDRAVLLPSPASQLGVSTVSPLTQFALKSDIVSPKQPEFPLQPELCTGRETSESTRALPSEPCSVCCTPQDAPVS